jgi:hypothetical protein
MIDFVEHRRIIGSALRERQVRVESLLISMYLWLGMALLLFARRYCALVALCSKQNLPIENCTTLAVDFRCISVCKEFMLLFLTRFVCLINMDAVA